MRPQRGSGNDQTGPVTIRSVGAALSPWAHGMRPDEARPDEMRSEEAPSAAAAMLRQLASSGSGGIRRPTEAG